MGPRGAARSFGMPMSLRSLLSYAHEDADVSALSGAARPGARERVFVSGSMRPYLLAALLDAEPERPGLVIAGDDRAARDLAADLKAFLAPRLVRFYPARGVRYESHLAPPPHLVGLRVAALDALMGAETGDAGAVVVASAAALCEKVPDPELRPHGFAIETPAPGVAYDKYVVAMANTGQPDSNGSQFFIDLAGLPQLPLNYTIFGKVTDGTSVIDAIGQVPTNGTPDTGPQNVPLDPVVIQSISMRGNAQPSQS